MKPLMLAAMLALAACSDGAPAGGPEVAAAAPAAAVATPAAAPAPAAVRVSQLPGPAVGRWNYNESRDGQTLPRDSQCIFDTVTLNEAYKLYRRPDPQCPQPIFRQEGSSILGSFACGDSRTEITITGNLASNYMLTEVVTSGNPASAATIITVATRTGECSGQPEPPLFPDPPSQ